MERNGNKVAWKSDDSRFLENGKFPCKLKNRCHSMTHCSNCIIMTHTLATDKLSWRFYYAERLQEAINYIIRDSFVKTALGHSHLHFIRFI